MEFISKVTPEMQPLIGRLYGNLARNGRIWIDGHVGNMYVVRNAAGRMVDIGIHDTDMITMARDPAAAPQLGYVMNVFGRQPGALERLLPNYYSQSLNGTLNGRVFMRDVYQVRFGVAPPF